MIHFKKDNFVKIVSFIFICGFYFIAGCQSEPEFWYKPGNNVSECWYDYSYDCSCNPECMYRKGYQLLKKENLPPNIKTKAVTEYNYHTAGKQYVLAGDNITEEEKQLNAKKTFIKNRPDLPDQIKQAIMEGNIVRGMTREEISVALNRRCNRCEWKLIARDSSGYEIWELGKWFRHLYSWPTFNAWYSFNFSGDKSVDWIEYGPEVPQ